MLFSGSASKPKKDEKKEKKDNRDEKYELQEQTFIRWANWLLGFERLSEPRHLSDPANAGIVVQTIVNQQIVFDDWPGILQYIGDVKTNPAEAVEGQQKSTLSAWWQIVQFYWKRNAPQQLKEEKLSEAIKRWCVEVTKAYEEIDVYDFTSSFRDGHAFNYLIHSYDRKLINLSKTAEMSAIERIENAFSLAEKELNVPRLLQPKELHSENLDSHSVLCYLMNLYLSMISGSRIEEELQKTTQMEEPKLERGEPSVESEVRSRKSSSSSQKSGKSRKQRRDEQMVEFRSCIEQVLTWLLEAEDELNLLSKRRANLSDSSLSEIRTQFSEFEAFMSSLTDSQETVGRVLSRGQQLAAKCDGGDEEKERILAKLNLVNSRWEELRRLAMCEQSELQHKIDEKQRAEIEMINEKLDEIESEMRTSFEPLATRVDEASRQIEKHQVFQKRLDEYQSIIDRLNSFVAVVDENGDDPSVGVSRLEEELTSVANRWSNICDSTEKRTQQLDGLAELLLTSNALWKNLNEWIVEINESIVDTTDAAMIEKSIEKEHSHFVELSQMTCELVSRYEMDEATKSHADEYRRRLDELTAKWDELVGMMEKRAQKELKKEKFSTDEQKEGQEEDESAKNQHHIDKFLMHITKVRRELDPLQSWSSTFDVNLKDDRHHLMNTCQEKLVEIKEQEARVNGLQLELEHLHSSQFRLNSRQLKQANDAFEEFASGWAQIVSKISEAMSILSAKHASPQESSSVPNEEFAVSKKIEQWICAVDMVITELANLPPKERSSRIEKLEQQLVVQNKNVEFIEHDNDRKAILRKGLEIAQKRLNALKMEKEEPMDMQKELNGPWSTVGNVEQLEADCKRADLIVATARKNKMSTELVEKAETRRAEMEERKRVTVAFQSALAATRKIVNEADMAIDRLSFSNIPETIKRLDKENENLKSRSSQKKELERTAEKMLSLDDDISENIVKETRTAVDEVIRKWNAIESQINEKMNRARSEQQLFIEKKLRDGQDAINDINRAINSKCELIDAETAAENLDMLERSLDTTEKLFDEIDNLPLDNDSKAQFEKLISDKKSLTERAKEAITQLTQTMSECEDFEKNVMLFQNWSTKINHLLISRKASDVTAYDIPHEYQVDSENFDKLIERLTAEFDEWSHRLNEMWRTVDERKDAQRMRDQMSHASDTMTDLREKFAAFKRPTHFTSRLERLMSCIAKIEQSLDEMTGIDGSECGGALMECRSLVRAVDDVAAEHADLALAAGQLVLDRMLEEEESEKVSRQLNEAKLKSKELNERISANIERLEDCNEMYQRLMKECDEIDTFLNEMERRLDEYAKSKDAIETEAISRLVNEWNRNESSFSSCQHLCKTLQQRGISMKNDVIGLKRLRADALKNRLNSWKNSSQEMVDDEETMLLDIDNLYTNLSSSLDNLLEEEDEDKVGERLRFLRNDRDRLSSKARKLAARNPRLAATSSKMLNDLSEKWSKAETKTRPTSSTCSLNLPKLENNGKFVENVQTLMSTYEDLRKFFDFDNYPVKSVDEYKQRVESINKYMNDNEHREIIEELIENGRRIAQTGRMELGTHQAIENLDEFANCREECELLLQEHDAKANQLMVQYEPWKMEASELLRKVQQYKERDLGKEEELEKTRIDLSEQDAIISSITSRSIAMQCQLPGKGSQMTDVLLENLRSQIDSIEAIINESYKNDEENNENKEEGNVEDNEEKNETSPERTSSMPLAMEAYATATEEDNSAPMKSTMDEVFEELERIEDEHALINAFIYDHVGPNGHNKLNENEESLKRCSSKLAKDEMIINIVQMDLAKERITHLIDNNGQLRKRLDDAQKKLDEFNQDLQDAINNDRDHTELGARFNEIQSRLSENSPLARQLQQQYAILLQPKPKSKMSTDEIQQQLHQILDYCTRAQKVASHSCNSLDSDGLATLRKEIGAFSDDHEHKRQQLIVVESSQPADASHQQRRLLSEAVKMMATTRDELHDAKTWSEQAMRECEAFWKSLRELDDSRSELAARIDSIQRAIIYQPSDANVSSCLETAARMKKRITEIKRQVQASNLPPAIKLAGKNAKKVVQVLTEAATVIANAEGLVEAEEPEGEAELEPSAVPSTEQSSVEPEEVEPEPEESSQDDEEEEITRIMQKETSSEPRASTDRDISCQLTHVRHWLHDVERDASQTVDLSDHEHARKVWSIIQGIIDEIRIKSVTVMGAHDRTANRQIKQQAGVIIDEMKKTIEMCERRCQQLNSMGDLSKTNKHQCDELAHWLDEMQISNEKVDELGDHTIQEELRRIDAITAVLGERKQQMEMANASANRLIDLFSKDEAHQLSHLMSKLNMRWTRFNDNLRVRRAALEAAIRSRRDLSQAIDEFDDWIGRQEEVAMKLDAATLNSQKIKDTLTRCKYSQMYKQLNADMNAHDRAIQSIVALSDTSKEETMTRVDLIQQRWKAHRNKVNEIGERIERAEQEWEKLSDGLVDLLAWIETKRATIHDQREIGGSLSTVTQQSAFVSSTRREIDNKELIFKNIIADAHSFLMQHDLRPKIQSTNVLQSDGEEMVGDLQREQRRRGLEINANCEKLKSDWEKLSVEIEELEKNVQHAMQRLQELERNIAECQLHLTSSENEISTMRAVESVRLEDLKTAREDTAEVARRIDEVRLFVDDVNDAAARILADDLMIDEHTRGQIENANKRFTILKRAIRIRQAAINNAASDFGPTSEHFLNQSVSLPWQRAISKANLLPYYIEQTTEKTQWEHPAWMEIMRELSQFNRVKFIAYRTAMKLRALQKRLCLDLVDEVLVELSFSRLKGLAPEECPGLEGVVCALLPMFEGLHKKYPNQVGSVSLAVDLCINFLLNLFDSSRDGVMRVLSFKIAIIVFSNIPLEQKFKYLFKLVSQNGHATQKQIALLLYDLIHIPRLVGESAAFGGSNVEPSVRSCFETVRLAPTISEAAFIDWIKKEPQSIVWLAVMHRLAVSESTKHQAKCNVCKMFPIVGLRYRCLSCFNLDLCQNCFFSQRVAKRHKLKHPMQEYSGKTSSTDDARDFAKILRNKLRTSRRQLAYLPIDVTQEGQPLTLPQERINNPKTDAINSNTSAMSRHLAKLGNERVLSALEPVQSPLQIINQVEQLQRDEMDQLLHRLQIENQQLRRELESKRFGSSSRLENRAGTLPARHRNRDTPIKSTHSQNDIMDEAKALRLHKQRLEHRSRILEQQNEQLEMQLNRLKKVIDSQSKWTPVTESKSLPRVRHNDSTDDEARMTGAHSVAQMQNLMNACDDLGRAMESLVVSVVYDSGDEQEQ